MSRKTQPTVDRESMHQGSRPEMRYKMVDASFFMIASLLRCFLANTKSKDIRLWSLAQRER